MAELKLKTALTSITASPTTTGFVRAGRQLTWDADMFGDSTKFEAGPCESPTSYPNKQSLCDGLLDDERDEVADADPKPVNELLWEEFYPWTAVDQIQCLMSDIVKERHLELVKTRLNNVRSSKYAQEFSDGIYSGSPSLRSNAVPLSDTAYSLQVAISRLLRARVQAEAPGPHFIHIPIAFKPFAKDLNLDSDEDVRLVFDNYVESYVPATNISGGGAATAPTANTQAWVGITGPFEYSYGEQDSDAAKTIDAKTANRMFIQGEEKLWFRYETCNTFLAKVTLYS